MPRPAMHFEKSSFIHAIQNYTAMTMTLQLPQTTDLFGPLDRVSGAHWVCMGLVLCWLTLYNVYSMLEPEGVESILFLSELVFITKISANGHVSMISYPSHTVPGQQSLPEAGYQYLVQISFTP